MTATLMSNVEAQIAAEAGRVPGEKIISTNRIQRAIQRPSNEKNNATTSLENMEDT